MSKIPVAERICSASEGGSGDEKVSVRNVWWITGGGRLAAAACSAGDNGGVGGDGEQAVIRIIVAMTGTRITHVRPATNITAMASCGTSSSVALDTATEPRGLPKMPLREGYS